MQVNIKGSAEITPEIRDYLDLKLDSLSKFIQEDAPDTVIADVELSKSVPSQTGPFCYAEINLTVDGQLYRATSHQESFEAALDIVKDELQRELTKGKDKRKTLARKGALNAKEKMLENAVADEL